MANVSSVLYSRRRIGRIGPSRLIKRWGISDTIHRMFRVLLKIDSCWQDVGYRSAISGPVVTQVFHSEVRRNGGSPADSSKLKPLAIRMCSQRSVQTS